VIVRFPVVADSASGTDTLTANVPDAFGRVSVGVPAVACAVIVAVPDVIPANPSVPCEAVGTPRTGVTVIAGTPDVLAFIIPPLTVEIPPITLAEDE
jgi:hypothetical protein